MSFEVAAEAYDRFMGNWSRPLAPQLAGLAGVRSGLSVLDVGCGPGALTTELATRLGPTAVTAVDPSAAHGPLGPFWLAARQLDAGVEDESRHAGTREGHLAELFEAAGLREVEQTALPVSRDHSNFEEWWEPFTHGVGPAGSFVSRLDEQQQVALRERCRAMLPTGAFTVPAQAWAARGVV